ncbi:MAG: right-handed parallel beta-helix repeat-containing protein [Planctomycetaceae bacterium]|nr:right-handed parallel beta-helix repeat-containing protein [Planctomycetaceae bacterium]
MCKRLFFFFALIPLVQSVIAEEKFTAQSDIVAVSVNGKAFTVHEQNHMPHWNSAPSGSAARMGELKNLMITGTLAAETTLNSIEITTAEADARATLFTDRQCKQPFELVGMTVKAGEQVYYIKVVAPEGNSCQVYTLSIMGLNDANRSQYYKYGEPTFVAGSYHTWIWALQNAKPGQIIAVTKIEQELYKTGEYQFKPVIENKQNLVIRSLTGNYEDLILRGHGFHKGAYRGGLPHDELFVVAGANTKNIIIYGITVQDSTANGFKLNGYGEENIVFDSCRMIDVNERAFKGSGPQIDGKYTRSKNISILNCWFENTQTPVDSDHMAEFNGNYIGGIDVMNISGLIIAGNTFKNVKSKSDSARPAIFIWGQDGCKDVVIENNIIINCDKGISLGNSSGNPAGNSVGGVYVNGAMIRNNFIYNPHWDFIEINRVNDVKMYNNTLWKANAARRGIRDSGGVTNPSHNISIINNIIRGAVNEHPHGNNIDIGHNLFYFNEPSGVVPGEGNITFDIPENFFMNAANGDFRLRESSTSAFRNGIPLPEVETDFFGIRRGATPDLGAHQFTEP